MQAAACQGFSLFFCVSMYLFIRLLVRCKWARCRRSRQLAPPPCLFVFVFVSVYLFSSQMEVGQMQLFICILFTIFCFFICLSVYLWFVYLFIFYFSKFFCIVYQVCHMQAAACQGSSLFIWIRQNSWALWNALQELPNEGLKPGMVNSPLLATFKGWGQYTKPSWGLKRMQIRLQQL